ncbi:MAG: amidohydrolase family protein [Deltaproteobacteria bacterium]|nr:amidohydrolase family protein [Deltaproteobacteria bacterium]MBW1719667.1 amidohydrolase family protein [Deltaproteobacteria bacterium]MBW1938480.1 amidohydrolase family protein [Deltaproteobacteria bacterium]MBW1965068.1 amidohydrolase family protein [Deltaproteobacteria bacterium]MBW2081179.1 amidohydrolase family protein [Deltaproteobacteria bacterium]
MRVPDKESAYTDIHVHAVPRNGNIQAHGWRRALFALAAKRSGAHGTGPEAARTYTENLARYLHSSRYVRRAVLLALDQAYDEQGKPHQAMIGFYVSNEDVLAWCRDAPEIFLFGASIHPHRRDAIEALERCAEQGAVLVKWLPNSQGIDPADRRLLPYYQKLAELGLPLLCHTGFEFALPAIHQAYGNLERLRLALEHGVIVIAAHSGSGGLFINRRALTRSEQMLRRYPNLYCDTAALALPNRMEALLWWRNHPEFFNRLLFATDFPLPLYALPWSLFLPHADYIRFAREHNPFDRMAELLKGLGVYPSPDAFESILRHSRWKKD